MRQSAATLEAFYTSRIGRAASALIARRISDLWASGPGEIILGIGYTLPVFAAWPAPHMVGLSVLPEEIGSPAPAPTHQGRVLLAPEHRLPFAEASFDRILMLHALEEADHPRQLMREAWRLLAPEGRLIIGTTNRRSLWSVNEALALGHGRPWTRRQLVRFLSESLFQVTASATAVHMPPLDWSVITSAANIWERVGDTAMPGFGGLVLVEATKRLYAEPGGTAGAVVTRTAKQGRMEPNLPNCEAASSGSDRPDKK